MKWISKRMRRGTARAGLSLLLAGFGCAWQRLVTGAHFVTDIYGALAIAWIVSAWIDGRLRQGWR